MLRGDDSLPMLGDWAISADLAEYLVSTIRDHRPRVVVELGSGASSILIALALREFATGSTLISIEEDSAYAETVRRDLAARGLSSIATIRDAPLQNGWYNQESLKDLAAIDLLVIDGPRGREGELVRYPALPALIGQLSGTCHVILDDTKRPEEYETALRWSREYPEFSSRPLALEKGAYLLLREDL